MRFGPRATGIALGFIAYVAGKVLTGRMKDIHPIMAVLAVLFVIKLGMG